MSNVLVIHPDDRSTDFLKRIYFDKNWDVINERYYDADKLLKEIENHDWIIMMGHGIPSGLLYTPVYELNTKITSALEKKKTTSIWCFSDEFFKKGNFAGKNELHTGMVISEVNEAMYMLGYSPLTKQELLNNMNLYADTIHDCIEMDSENMKKYFLDHYTGNDEITKFNRNTFIIL